MVDDAMVCLSVCSSSKTPVTGERAKVLSSREEGMENQTKLSKRSATVKKISHKCNKAKGSSNENKKGSEIKTK